MTLEKENRSKRAKSFIIITLFLCAPILIHYASQKPPSLTLESHNSRIDRYSTVSNSPISFDGSNSSQTNGSKYFVSKTISLDSGGLIPEGVAYSQNGYIYVTYGTNLISIINASSDKIVKDITVGSSSYSAAYGITYGSNGLVYVTGTSPSNTGSNSVTVINSATNLVVDNITLGSFPEGIVYGNNGFIYVVNAQSNNVSVIDSSTNKVVDTVSLGSYLTSFKLLISGITYAPNGMIYVVNPNINGNNVFVIDSASNKIVANISVGSQPRGIVYGGGSVYVTNTQSNNVSVINISVNKVVANISTMSYPYGISSSSNYIYVTNSNNNSLTIISTSTNTVKEKISVGTEPSQVTAGSDGCIYVTNELSDSLSIITTNINEVFFVERGLYSGFPWNVSIGESTNSSSSNQITFKLANGTYSYHVFTSDTNLSASSAYGTINVNGGPIWIYEYFYIHRYEVKFLETGLISGKKWSINLTNGQSYSSSANNISFSEPNGSYSFVVSNISNYIVNNSRGQFEVSGETVLENINFTMLPLVKIIVSPSSAIVSINGVKEITHNGAISIYLRQGFYYINASEYDYKDYSDCVNLSYNHTYYYNISLSSIGNEGYLSGSIFPQKSTIMANGIPIPVSDGHFNSTLPDGTYYISLMDYGYQDIVKEVNITSGKTSVINVSLTPFSDTITLSGSLDPGNASLVVDGFVAYVNSSGYYSIIVPIGTYTVSVFESGYFPYSTPLTLRTNETKNFTLVKEPESTSTVVNNSLTAIGYNVTASNLSNNGGEISLSFNSSANGSLIIAVPFADLENTSLSEILNSTIYINGVQYLNYTLSISSNYTVILNVYGLNSGDPKLYWEYSPSAIIPKPVVPSPKPVTQPLSEPEIIFATLLIGIALGISGSYLRKKVR